MKKNIIFFLSVSVFAFTSEAQVKPVVMTIIKTPTVVCEKCKKRIECYLKQYDGILEINVNYRKGETRVKYITDRINIEEIKTHISNCGYDADDVLAAEDAYKRLPKCCQKYRNGEEPTKPKPISQPEQQ